MKLKSNRITSIRRKGSRFIFAGKGWGHGVGLCQYGMKKLAELGYSYRDILKYYYPGSQVTTLKSGSGETSGGGDQTCDEDGAEGDHGDTARS